MVVHNLNVFRACIGPAEANAPLIIDADAVLSAAVPFQRFKMITRRNPEVFKPAGDLQLPQLSPGDGGYIHKPLGALTL